MKKNKKDFIGWLIIAVALLSAVAVYFVEGLMWAFLVLLILNLLYSVIFRKYFSPAAITLSRVLIGALFIFSGFVKAVDPMGTVFKMEEYMVAYGTEWAMPLVPAVAILMITVEFALGFFAILNIKPKFTFAIITLMMAGYTVLTFLDALNNPVSDCGCFGDFIIMSNWQTFYKNLVIDTVLLAILFNFKYVRTRLSGMAQFALGGFIMVMTLGVEIYTYYHLPIMDFLPWKVGSKTVMEERLPVTFFFTCENQETGERKEFPYDDISAQLSDSAWNATWTIVSRRDIDPNPKPHNLRIINDAGDDVTGDYLEVDNPTFIATAYDIERWHSGALPKLTQLYHDATNNGYNFVMLVDEEPQKIEIFVNEHDIEFPVYTGDGTELKMMNRSNPGVTLIQNKTVKHKWSYHNIPDAKGVEMAVE
ncbi:MAG: DoxX family protein [Bacteroidales bacterium]|nr:DoxX family protein [Bacteroidales bacterium]